MPNVFSGGAGIAGFNGGMPEVVPAPAAA